MHELIKCENNVAMSKTVCLMSKGMETLIYTTHSTTGVSRSFSLTLTPHLVSFTAPCMVQMCVDRYMLLLNLYEGKK